MVGEGLHLAILLHYYDSLMGRGALLIEDMVVVMLIPTHSRPFVGRMHDQYSNYDKGFSSPRGSNLGSHPGYGYGSEYRPRPNYYESQVQILQQSVPRNDGRNDFDYNISTSNQFFPLRDLEGPRVNYNHRGGDDYDTSYSWA